MASLLVVVSGCEAILGSLSFFLDLTVLKPENKFIFSPTDIIRFFESEFASYMDHFEKVVSKEALQKQGVHRDPKDPLYDVIAQMGNEHEKAIISNLEGQEKIIKIEKSKLNRSNCIKQTFFCNEKWG